MISNGFAPAITSDFPLSPMAMFPSTTLPPPPPPPHGVIPSSLPDFDLLELPASSPLIDLARDVDADDDAKMSDDDHQSGTTRSIARSTSLRCVPISNQPQFLTFDHPCSKLPGFWRPFFPVSVRARVRRLYVTPDGSCATGAVMLCLFEPDDVDDMLPLPQLTRPSHTPHSPATLHTLRSQLIAGQVADWAPETWCQNVPEILRTEFWASLGPCSCRLSNRSASCSCARSVRTPEQELREFCALLDLPNYHHGDTFFHVAAGVLRVNIIILMNDARLGKSDGHLAYDFGSGAYPKTILLFAIHHAKSDSGHFEAIGLADSDCPEPQHFETTFPSDHPVIAQVRRMLASRSDAHKTLAHERLMAWFFYPPFPSSTVAATAQSIPPPVGAGAEGSTRLNAPPPAAPPFPPGFSGSRVLPARRHVLPVRYRTTIGESCGTRAPSTARRAQSAALSLALPRSPPSVDPLAAVAESVPDTAAGTATLPGAPVPDAAVRAGHVAASGARTDTSAPLSRSVAAAPRSPPSDRHIHASSELLSNVRHFIRSMTRRGRPIERVHITAAPMWVMRSRQVLQAFGPSLQAVPLDEMRVAADFCSWWFLYQEVFVPPGPPRGGAAGRRARINRIHHVLNDCNLVPRVMDAAAQMVTGLFAGLHSDEWDDVDVLEALSPSDTSDAATRSGSNSAGPRAAHGDTAASDSPLPAGASRADVSAAHRAEYQFIAGHTSRATKTLTSSTRKADVNDAEEREIMERLHPRYTGSMPVCPADYAAIAADPSWIAYEMRATDTGACPGPSGFASNAIALLATDTICVQAMALLIQHIMNRTLPPALRTVLTTSTLVSLRKPHGDGSGRRPIAIGDVFCRMAARYVLRRVKYNAQRILHGIQFAVGEPDGCSQIVQSVQHLLEAPPRPTTPPPSPHPPLASSALRNSELPVDRTPRPLACLSIDITNAFNSINRRRMLETVYAHHELAACWRMVDFCYGRPSLLLMPCDDTVSDDEAFIESQTGVRQGDPLSPVLFSLAVHPVFRAIAEHLKAGVFAFMDDAHGVGYLEQCWMALQRLPDLLAPLDLTINLAKCKLTCFHLDSVRHEGDRAALRCFESAGIRINRRTLRLLGCVVGATPEDIAELLATDNAFHAGRRTALRRLQLMQRRHNQASVLPYLSGSVINNRLRGMRPAATARHAAEHDAELLRVAHSVMHVAPDEHARCDEQIGWAGAMGGCGLIPAVEIAPAAYLAGAEVTLRRSPTFAAVWAGTTPLDPGCGMYAAIDDSLRCIHDREAALLRLCGEGSPAKQVSASVLPGSAAHFVAHFQAQPSDTLIQHSVQHRNQLLKAIAGRTVAGQDRSPAGIANVARLEALRGVHASRWLLQPVRDWPQVLSDAEFRWAIRMRLGLSGLPGPPAPCGHPRAPAEDSWHPLCCHEKFGAAITARHHQVVKIIADFCRAGGLTARSEPADLAPDRDLRPDIQVDLPELTILGDVTVRHPTAASWRDESASERGVDGVGARVATKKHAIYDELARGLGMAFSPIVVYTYGGFDVTTMSFVKSLFRAIDPATSLISAVEWRETFLSAIAIAVQRWTAKIMVNAAQRQRAAALSSRLTSLATSHPAGRRGPYVPVPHRHASTFQPSPAEPGARGTRLAAQLLALPAPDGGGPRDPADVDLPDVRSDVNSVHNAAVNPARPPVAASPPPAPGAGPTEEVPEWVPSSLAADDDVELPPTSAGRSPAVPSDDVIMGDAEGGRFAPGEALLVR